MKNKKWIIILFLLLIVIIGVLVLYKPNNKEMNQINNTTVNKTLTNIVENIEYVEVTIEDENAIGAEYKDLVKIEDTEVIENLANMINLGKEHKFNGAFGFDIPPYAIFHLKNGNEIMICAIDDFEMIGEENGNYILVTVNNNENDKTAYKVQDKIATIFSKLYNENKKQDSNEEFIILYDGLEIEKKVGTQYLDYMKITDENKFRYEITYNNYEKGKILGETKGTFGKENVYDGYSYVENVKKIAISKKYNAMPRNATKIKEIPENLQDLVDYTSTDIEAIDLDNDGNLEYIICVNQYTNSKDYENVNKNETYSEIMLFDNEFNKIETLATWENKDVQEELSKEMCLRLNNVIYLDIDNDNNMEILINLPSYDASILSILKYNNNKIQGEINYKVNLEP